MSSEPGPDGRHVDAATLSPEADLVEYMVLTTPGLSSGRAVAPVLRAIVECSHIRVLDLVAVQTDALGAFRVIDSDSLLGLARIRNSDQVAGGGLSDDDIALVCGALGPNASALILLAEDRWARALADAAQSVGGRVVGGERIPRRSIERSQRDGRNAPASRRSRGRLDKSRRQSVDLLRRRPILDDGRVHGQLHL